jgi:outer membrane protein assembly factor BamB
VDGRQELISPASGFVGAYEPQSGREIWRVRYGEGYSVVPRPVFAHGLLFLSSGFDRPILYAIKPEGAKGDATASHVAWTVSKGAPTTPSPLALGNELYIVSDGGVASCLDAKTGNILWNERLGGGFSASPVSAENRIYFQNESGVGFVVAAGTNYQLLAKNDLGERSLASPAVIDNAIFIRTESHLWRVQGNGSK